MGMFDDVRCKYPLPGVDPGMRYQTKDFDCYMDQYEITEDGRLMKSLGRTEDQSDPTAPKGSIKSLAGCMTYVHERWEDLKFHGMLNFYTTRPKNSDHQHIWAKEGCYCGMKYRSDSEEWIEFNAKFTDGRIVSVERIKEAF